MTGRQLNISIDARRALPADSVEGEMKMDRALPDDVRKDTSKCPHAFSCCSTGLCGSASLCKVQSELGKNMLFVDIEKDATVFLCPYFMSFGTGFLCICPTHYAIHLTNKRRQ